MVTILANKIVLEKTRSVPSDPAGINTSGIRLSHPGAQLVWKLWTQSTDLQRSVSPKDSLLKWEHGQGETNRKAWFLFCA